MLKGMSTRMMTKSEKQVYRDRLRTAAAIQAVEGIHLTAEERSIFAYMAEAGMTALQRQRYLNDYIEGRVKPPALTAAE